MAAPAPGMVPVTFQAALICDWYRSFAALGLASVLFAAATCDGANPAKVAYYTVILAQLLGPDVYTS